MILLLLLSATIYFISGKISDGLFMTAAIVFEILLSFYHSSKSRKALEKLTQLTEPNCKVIRNNKLCSIKSSEIVIGDYLWIEEGNSIVADGNIVHSNDFSVNESILTGESMPVEKNVQSANNIIYRGTSVVSGLAIVQTTAIGNKTQLGIIGKSLESISEEKTPLELQIKSFVKYMMLVGSIVFIIVWLINFFVSHHLLDSLLKALTLAMSIVPEEIPVAISTFMALGAWRLMKTGIVVKQMKTVETLGSATVICVDKTGTITENRMSLKKLYVHSEHKISEAGKTENKALIHLLQTAMFASEPIPFDPMETALHEAYTESCPIDERANYKMVHEYPLGGIPPMMTHVFGNEAGQTIIAAKGAPESILKVCRLTDEELHSVNKAIHSMAADGYRLLGVACNTNHKGKYPEHQHQLEFEFLGLVAFYDPPKINSKEVLNKFYQAGITVKIITGDNSITTHSIAKQIDFKGHEKSITGDELMKLSDLELQKIVGSIHIYTRMFPEAKLRIIQALKANGEIVAMTGDGVNDGPALKAAHIGIAMGKKGTEIAKQAAALILVQDDLSKMVEAIAMGRKIYANLKKAIQYIISIHIPIILTVFIPLVLGWKYPYIFSPIHVIFLELIMGPTCSIIYENEPIEKKLMQQKPRPFSLTFFNRKEISTSILQGLIITLGILFIYQYSVYCFASEFTTRTMVFTTLISANILLTLVNRSFYYSIIASLSNKNKLLPIIISITVIGSTMLIYLKPLANFFEFTALTQKEILISTGIGWLSVIWFELVKWWKRKINEKELVTNQPMIDKI